MRSDVLLHSIIVMSELVSWLGGIGPWQEVLFFIMCICLNLFMELMHVFTSQLGKHIAASALTYSPIQVNVHNLPSACFSQF